MTTINITRRKQPIRFLGKLTILTAEGNSVSLKAGETAVLSTNHPETLLVKRFIGEKQVSTGVPSNTIAENISLELFYNLSNRAMITLCITAVVLLAVALSRINQSAWYHSSSVIPILFIILIARTIRSSLTIKEISE